MVIPLLRVKEYGEYVKQCCCSRYLLVQTSDAPAVAFCWMHVFRSAYGRTKQPVIPCDCQSALAKLACERNNIHSQDCGSQVTVSAEHNGSRAVSVEQPAHQRAFGAALIAANSKRSGRLSRCPAHVSTHWPEQNVEAVYENAVGETFWMNPARTIFHPGKTLANRLSARRATMFLSLLTFDERAPFGQLQGEMDGSASYGFACAMRTTCMICYPRSSGLSLRR